MNAITKLGLISIAAGIGILATIGFGVIISSALAQTTLDNVTMSGNATSGGNATNATSGGNTTAASGQISGHSR
jgi:hypothetical protein